MIEISSGDLRVELLDPETDRARLGPRFAWGGFVWQVHDRTAGPLLAGPEWPSPAPLPFNGQGAPESFRHRKRSGEPLTWSAAGGVSLGAGVIAETGGDLRVVAPCAWTLTRFPCGVRWRTRHAAAGFDYQLERTVELVDRELRSHSRLTNHAATPLPLEWFVHPFFALTDGRIAAELPRSATLPENPGFALVDGQFTQRRVFQGLHDGQFELLRLPPGEPLRCRLTHPRLTRVDFATSFVPRECPVWGNGNTFSIEPYLAATLEPGATLDWDVRYGFGAAR